MKTKWLKLSVGAHIIACLALSPMFTTLNAMAKDSKGGNGNNNQQANDDKKKQEEEKKAAEKKAAEEKAAEKKAAEKKAAEEKAKEEKARQEKEREKEQEKHDKVTICHKGHTIEVSRNALQAHLNHGDTIGPCNVTPDKNR